MSEFINRSGSFATRIVSFYEGLVPDFKLPDGVEILQPYQHPAVRKVVETFYEKYYNDNRPRIFLLGINPGRFGGGITGIPFTDPLKLDDLGIRHDFQRKAELSSDFIYRMIEAYGGMRKFAEDFFLTAICPLGFTLNAKNFNYYDDRELESAARGWIIKTMEKQLAAGARRDIAICLGEGSNYKYLSRLNEEQKWFKELRALPHPRWIMQYNRKKTDYYIEKYTGLLGSVPEK